MANLHTAVLAGAALSLLCLPCVVALLVRSEEPAVRRAWVQQSRRDASALRRLDHGMCAVVPAMREPEPSLDQLAVDLRRLDRQRRPGATIGSERWRAAVVRAYDHRLRLACRSLGLSQHLHQLHGLDLDIERVRVEGRLQDEGLELR